MSTQDVVLRGFGSTSTKQLVVLAGFGAGATPAIVGMGGSGHKKRKRPITIEIWEKPEKRETLQHLVDQITGPAPNLTAGDSDLTLSSDALAGIEPEDAAAVVLLLLED